MKVLSSVILGITFLAAACATSGASSKIDELKISKHPFTINGREGAIYAIPTGTIQIKHCHFANCLDEDSSYPARLIGIFFSRKPHGERLPIYTYLIDHPEGRYLVDAGGDPLWNDNDSWQCDKRSKFASRILADVQVPQKEDLISQIKSLGFNPQDIKSVVITHLHFDHTAALKQLNLPTYIGGADLEAAGKIGAVTCKYLDGVDLIKTEPLLTERPASEKKLGDTLFGRSLSLTSDDSLRVYSTPGHTPGSLSIKLSTDQGQIWFIGDITFSDAAILQNSKVAGMHFNIPQIRQIHDKLRVLLNMEKSIVVPSHDKLISKKLNSFFEQK